MLFKLDVCTFKYKTAKAGPRSVCRRRCAKSDNCPKVMSLESVSLTSKPLYFQWLKCVIYPGGFDKEENYVD